MEKRFSYNPFTKDFLICDTSHSICLYNKGKQHLFDEYIRGIIKDGILYLRVYYPFKDIDSLTNIEIKQKSRMLLTQYANDVLKLIDKEYSFIPSLIHYNADNDLFKGTLTNI